MELTPVTIELDIGHTDAVGKKHTAVVFGKRITGKELFAIDADPQGAIATQYQLLLLRSAITEFGTLKMPVPLKVLLDLDSIDTDDLNNAFNRFSAAGLGDRQVEQLADDKVRLAIGYEANGLTYDVVTFGSRLTGMDEVEADLLKLEGVARVCFLAGKAITQFSQSDGASVLDGPMPLAMFERLDAVDIQGIKAGSEVYRQSFRRAGARVSVERGSQNGAAADAGTGASGK